MIELVLSMMLWIHNVTGYTIPEPPDISLVSKEIMLSYAYGCDLDPIPEENIQLCDTRKDWNLSEDGPLGMYDHVKKAIIMPDDFDINSIHDKSILLHEVVHHLQYANDVHNNVECKAKLEKEAYELQDEWLRKKHNTNLYETVGMNKVFFYLKTECMHHFY